MLLNYPELTLEAFLFWMYLANFMYSALQL